MPSPSFKFKRVNDFCKANILDTCTSMLTDFARVVLQIKLVNDSLKDRNIPAPDLL